MCPKTLGGAYVKEHCEEDWLNDTHGKEALNYDDFFDSMFQLVDTWTETCNAEDYIEALLRLVDGICFNKAGAIHFKKDEKIAYDR